MSNTAFAGSGTPFDGASDLMDGISCDIDQNGIDNGDYYISPQQFLNGSKAFRITAASYAEIVGGEKQRVEIGYGAIKEDFPDIGDQTKDDSGGETIGYMRAYEGDRENARITYYVNGGSTGEGYMVVAFLGSLKNPGPLAHFLGCLTTTDMTFAGLGTLDDYTYIDSEGNTVHAFQTPAMGRVLLVSMEGVRIKVTYHFAQGTCEVVLSYATAQEAEDGQVVEFGDAVKLETRYNAGTPTL